MSGPPRKPTALKLLGGTFRPDRASAREPELPLGIPPKPPHIEASPAESAEWDRVAPLLSHAGVLCTSDLAILTLYCDAWGRYTALTVAARKIGAIKGSAARRDSTTKDGKKLARAIAPIMSELDKHGTGAIQVSQIASARRAAAQDVYRFAIELGLTSPSRARLTAMASPDTGKSTGKLMGFLNGGRPA